MPLRELLLRVRIKVGLKPFIKVKKCIQRQIDNVLSRIKYTINNAVSKGLSRNIQMLKSAYRQRILSIRELSQSDFSFSAANSVS